MTIALWVILVHVIECLLIGGYLLIRKNSQLEKVLVSQQQYIDAISVVIDNSSNTIQELDNRGAFESDDEVGGVFTEIKTIVENLNEII